MIETKEKVEVKDFEVTLLNGEVAKIKDSENFKVLKSSDYNFYFNKKTGYFVRFGKGNYNNIPKTINKQEMDLFVTWSAIWGEKFNIKEFVADLQTDGNPRVMLPEIADIELSVSCHGVSGVGVCAFCYKSNVPQKDGFGNMSLETFKKVFKKLPKSIGQIAFGLTDIDANPDMWDIFDYTREQGVIPNATINGDRMTPEYFDRIANTLGACAVSLYDKDMTYNAIHELTKRGMKQVNIHFMISSETEETAYQLMKDYKTDERLKGLNAIVFLSLKQKGRSKDSFTRLSDEKYKNLVDYALDNDITIGFDSCGQPKFAKSVKDRENADDLIQMSESCESTLTSLYINSGEVDENGISDPKFYPCSFSEKVSNAPGDWSNGISIIHTDDFLKDVWFAKKTREFSDVTISNQSCGIACPMYNI